MKPGIPFLLLFFALAASSALARPISDQSIAQVFEESGLDGVISGIPGQFRQEFDQFSQHGGYPVPADELPAIRAIVANAFSEQRIRRLVIESVKHQVSEDDAAQLLAWYRSDLGRRITGLEQESATPGAQQEMWRRAKALMLSEARVNIAKALDKISGGTALTLRVQDLAITALYTAFAERTQKRRPIDTVKLKTELAESAPTRRADAQRLFILRGIYTYKQLDLDKLRNYVEFLRSPASTHLYDAVTQGVLLASSEAIDKFSKALAARYAPDDSASPARH